MINYNPIPELSEGDIMLFWSKVNRGEENDCWNYLKDTSGGGYGVISINISKNNRISFSAHRIAYYIVNGVDPLYLDVLHTCDNTRCCNPKHLFLGTQKSNGSDMVSKNRQAKGSLNGSSKLTEEQVFEIRHKRLILNTIYEELAKEYNVYFTTIHKICNYESWRHI